MSFPVVLFLVIVIGLRLWSVYERHRFRNFDGPMRRGVRIWTVPLDLEILHFLDTLPHTIRDEADYIRTENREILISVDETRTFWGNLFGNRRRLVYVGYVDLRASDRQLQLRMPLSDAIWIVIWLLAVIVIFPILIIRTSTGPSLVFVFIIIAFLVSIVSFWIAHNSERKRIVTILEQAFSQAK